MRNCLRAAVLALFFVGAASAGEVGYRAHTPSQSPFKAIGSEVPTPQQLSLEYRGRATIRAKYRFVYDQGYGREEKLHLDLLPEPESQALLPYLTRWAHESSKSDKKVMVTDNAQELWVTNVSDAAVALLGKELAADVMAGKYEKVYGEAQVVIDGFRADYTCTRPLFITAFVKVETEIAPPAPTKVKLLASKD